MAGPPLTPQLQTDFSRTRNSGTADRPDLVPGYSLNPILGTPEYWVDPQAFTPPPGAEMWYLLKQRRGWPPERRSVFALSLGIPVNLSLEDRKKGA